MVLLVELWPEGIFIKRPPNFVNVANMFCYKDRLKLKERWIQKTSWIGGKGTVGDVIDYYYYNYLIQNCQKFAEKICVRSTLS